LVSLAGFSIPGGDTVSDNPEAIIALALDKGFTLGVAESLTGGDVCSALVSVPGASEVVIGGIVAYSPLVKNQLLGVDAGYLATHGAVNASVATAMAEGVAERLGVDIAVATTGVAGPDPEPVSGVAVGTIFIAVTGGPLGTLVREFVAEGDRGEIRARATRAALQALFDAVSMRE
jgi:nicotinamide-nucleotide amidase